MRRIPFVLALAFCAAGVHTSAAEKQCKADPRGNAFGYWKNCGTASAVIGVDGGAVTTPAGASVTVPFGAVDRPVTVTVQTGTAPAPGGVGAVSPLYQFGPEGTVFAKPVTVSLPLPPGVTDASVYWTTLGSTTEFEAIGGTIANGFITVETPHFSLAVIGAAAAVRTVNGVGMTTFISATSRQTLPQDFTTIPVEAVVRDAAGNLVSIPAVPGTGAALGTFTITGVPRGQYTLHAGSRYLVTTTSSPDLGSSHGGRPDVTPLGNHSAFLDFSLTNLAPWQPDSLLEIFSTEANLWDFGIHRAASPPLANGQTDASFTFNLADANGTPGEPPNLIQGSKGDHLYAAQLSDATSGNGLPYLAMSRVIQFPLFDTLVDGTVRLSGAMLDVQRAKTTSFDFRSSAFRARILSEANPNTRLTCLGCNGSVSVLGQAGTTKDGFYASNADLLVFTESTGVDVLTGAMAYGSPANANLVGSWGEIGSVRWTGLVFYPFPGKLAAFLSAGFNWSADALAFAAPRVLTPSISFVRNLTIDGADAFANQTLASATPTVSWTAPSLGVPTHYSIRAYEVFVSPAFVRAQKRLVATIFTPNTAFQFLPDTLQSGHQYALEVVAIDASAATNAPFRTVLDSAEAFTPTGLLTIP
jgi:hypothetical protein